MICYAWDTPHRHHSPPPHHFRVCSCPDVVMCVRLVAHHHIQLRSVSLVAMCQTCTVSPYPPPATATLIDHWERKKNKKKHKKQEKKIRFTASFYVVLCGLTANNDKQWTREKKAISDYAKAKSIANRQRWRSIKPHIGIYIQNRYMASVARWHPSSLSLYVFYGAHVLARPVEQEISF